MKRPAQIMAHADAETLLPWYANGTLDDDQRIAVQRHLGVCKSCQQELHQLEDVQAVHDDRLSELAVPAPNVERLLDKLEAKEAAARTTASEQPARPGLGRILSAWTDGMAARWLIAVPIIAVAVVTAGVWRFLSVTPGQSPAEYETLSAGPVAGEHALRIGLVAQPSMALSTLAQLIDDAGIKGEVHNQGQGRFAVTLNEQPSPAQLLDALKALKRSPGIERAELIAE